MALRFRKSVKLAPGIRMNVSGSGVSWTLGPRGSSVGIGKRGTYLNTGLSGTGLFARERIGGSEPKGSSLSTKSAAVTRPTGSLTALVKLHDDGSVSLVDAAGNPISAEWAALAKTQAATSIKTFLDDACNRINADINATLNLHYDTPAPTVRLRYEPTPFRDLKPVAPTLASLRWWLAWLASHNTSVARKNEALTREHESDVANWNVLREAHTKQQDERKYFIEQAITDDPEAREQWIEEQLASITWPRETLIRYELSADGARIDLDVNFPEIEDMPTRTARPAERGMRVIFKPFAARALEQNYARHIHGLLLRLIGEMYSALPMLALVVASGYTQRRDPATGQMGDDYVLSMWTPRNQWMALDFEHMGHIDPIEAITRFEHRRNMTAGGKLKAITPFSEIETSR